MKGSPEQQRRTGSLPQGRGPTLGPRPQFSASSLRAEPGVGGGWAQEGAVWLLHLFPRSPADPPVLTKDLFKVFPVVSAVNA